jgi:uncharacterized protein YegP (UPF0339 family)
MILKTQFFVDRRGKSRFRIIDCSNGNILAKSPRGYAEEETAQVAIDEARTCCNVRVIEDRRGDFWWRMVNREGDIVMMSSEGYRNKNHCSDMAWKVMENV